MADEEPTEPTDDTVIKEGTDGEPTDDTVVKEGTDGEDKTNVESTDENFDRKKEACVFSVKYDAETKTDLADEVAQNIEEFKPISVNFRVDDFLPTEVKVTSNNDARTVFVEAKHFENSNGFNYCSKELYRKFTVPGEYNLNEMSHNIADGLLNIKIPIKPNDKRTSSYLRILPKKALKKFDLKVDMNVEQYKSNEITVTTDAASRIVTIIAKNMQETNGSVFVARQMTRKFNVPDKYKISELSHNISNGELHILVPMNSISFVDLIRNDSNNDEIELKVVDE